MAESGLIRSVHVEDVNNLAAGSRYNVDATIVGNGVFLAEGVWLRDVIAVRKEQEQLQELIDIDVVDVLPRERRRMRTGSYELTIKNLLKLIHYR